MKSGRIAATGQDLRAGIFAWAGMLVMLSVSLAAIGQASALPPDPKAGPLEQGAEQVFEIPAQPLQAALERFMTITAYSGIYDSAITAGLLSAEVSGLMTPEDALRQLVSGTGLSVRYAAQQTFTVIHPVIAVPDIAPAQPGSQAGLSDHGRMAYYGLLQAHIKDVFCRHPSTMPGTYHVALSLWINAAGSVTKVNLLDGSGSPERDARISAGLQHMQLPPPQAGMRQPVTLVFLHKPEGAANDCAESVQSGARG